jgi:biopolymer transport protein TolQ
MSTDLSIIHLIAGASLVVQLVMLILLLGSFVSWSLILSFRGQVKAVKAGIISFENDFWSAEDLTQLYSRISRDENRVEGLEKIFESGFKEFLKLRKKENLDSGDILDGAQRAMNVAIDRELETFEARLPTLATVGSVSPYIGLFGTVWGIMNSFQSLGNVHQATLALVAPGIAEALVATAMGLFAAIPAVIAYNRFSSELDRIQGKYEIFVEEFLAILRRQVNS